MNCISKRDRRKGRQWGNSRTTRSLQPGPLFLRSAFRLTKSLNATINLRNIRSSFWMNTGGIWEAIVNSVFIWRLMFLEESAQNVRSEISRWNLEIKGSRFCDLEIEFASIESRDGCLNGSVFDSYLPNFNSIATRVNIQSVDFHKVRLPLLRKTTSCSNFIFVLQTLLLPCLRLRSSLRAKCSCKSLTLQMSWSKTISRRSHGLWFFKCSIPASISLLIFWVVILPKYGSIQELNK